MVSRLLTPARLTSGLTSQILVSEVNSFAAFFSIRVLQITASMAALKVTSRTLPIVIPW